MQTLWQDLIRSALVGVQNRPPEPPQGVSDVAGVLLADLATTDDVGWTLDAAAVVALRWRAGQLVARPFEGEWPTPCPPEAHSACPPVITQYLLQLVEGQLPKRLLGDVLHKLRATKTRVPHSALVPLLDLLYEEARKGNIYPDMRAIIGERGWWLAAQRKRWTFLLWEEDFEAAWAASNAKVRSALFRQWRQLDPAAARAFFDRKRNRMRVDDRARYVDWFRVGLSSGDEPLLESLLDDGNSEVVLAAARCLRQLPGSAYVGRMASRLQGRFRLQQRTDESYQLMVTPVETTTPDMKRDGIGLHKDPTLTPQQNQLFTMICSVPPGLFCEWLGASPEALIAAATGNEQLYIRAWLRATLSHDDKAWAWALAEQYILPQDPSQLHWVLPVFSPAERDALIIRAWDSGRSFYQYMSLAEETPWSLALSQEVFKILEGALAQDEKETLRWLRYALPRLTLECAPEILPQLNDLLRPLLSQEELATGKLLGIVQDVLILAEVRRKLHAPSA